MNLQTREIRSRRPVKKNTGNKPVGVIGMMTLFELLVLGIVLFFIINYRISLKDDIGRMTRDAAAGKAKIDRFEREIEHLKLRRENLSRWAHVRSKIKQYNLAMVFPNPGQIKQLVIVRDAPMLSSQDSSKEPLMLSQR